MARMWKRFKKYERHFLIGLVVILLATFSVSSAFRQCSGTVHGERDFGGSLETVPGRRVNVSDEQFRTVRVRYVPFLTVAGWGPSIRYGTEMIGQQTLGGDRDLATWAHIAAVEAAKAAGYLVSDEELQQGIETLVNRRNSQGGRSGFVPFTTEAYDQVLQSQGNGYRGGPKADFELTVREILLKDKFLAPVIDGVRFSKSHEEAYADWKASRERIDLAYGAVPAAQFLAAVTLEEQTRTTLAKQGEALDKFVLATRGVKFLASVAKDYAKPPGAPAKDIEELLAKEPSKSRIGGKVPQDPWQHDLVYRSKPTGIEVLSIGPDGKEGTADDIGLDLVDALDALERLRKVAQAIIDWQAKAQKWPASLADLTTAPPKPAGATGAFVAPLLEVDKDPWGHDFAYDPAGPSLTCLGPDGVKGTADDVSAAFGKTSATVPVPARFDPWIDRTAKDAYGRALSVSLRAGPVTALDATSAGPDGVPGNDDDVTTGNASDMQVFYNRVRSDFRLPLRREFEALWTVLPLVPDEAFAKAWKAFEKYRPSESTCYDRWRRHTGYYYKTQDGEGPDAKKIDPADPEKGHGADVVKALKESKDGKKAAIPADAKVWLVPAPETLGDQKDLPKDGLPAPATDPLFQTYVDKGWRRVLLREMFFEKLFDDVLARARESHKAHVEWEKLAPPRPPEPAEKTFDVLLAEFKDFQPGTADHDAGARFVELWKTERPYEFKDWEAIPEFGEPNLSVALKSLKDGEYAALPTVARSSCARVAIHAIKELPATDQDLEIVRAEVMPRYLQSRCMDRAVDELDRVRKEAAAAKDPKTVQIADLVKAAAEKRKFEWTSGRTGPFVGSALQRPLVPPEGATPEEKSAILRRSYVRQNGYEVVQASQSRQDSTAATEGAVGRRVLREEATGKGDDAKPGYAYVVQVAWRKDPSPEEFNGTRYAEWLASKAYDENAPRYASNRPLKNREGFVLQQITRFFDDWDNIKHMFDIRTNQPIEIPVVR